VNHAADRPAFVEHLHQSGIQTSLHYPPIHRFSAYRSLYPEDHDLPLTEQAAVRLVTLPLFPTLTDWQIEAVIESINRFQA
jgi:dTDP-4-amino-4,6-dideoxygalactose transaminase